MQESNQAPATPLTPQPTPTLPQPPPPAPLPRALSLGGNVCRRRALPCRVLEYLEREGLLSPAEEGYGEEEGSEDLCVPEEGPKNAHEVS